MAVLSQRAYAKHRGVALSAVQKAISTGRISTMADGRIDPGVADGEWAANTKARPPAVRRQQGEDEGDAFGAAQYSKARAVREHYQARLAKIEYEERVGSLVSKDEVQVAAFNTHRVIRDAMLNIPDRIAAMLAAETDEAKCYEILATEIRKALNEFADANA